MNPSQPYLSTIGRRLVATGVVALAACQFAYAEEDMQFQALLHDKDIYGAEDIADGRYELGIERLARRVDNTRGPFTTRVPALIDLCVAYTMTEQFDKAEQACDEAVDSGWYSGYAYNNRGTYNIAIGNYAAAVRDFQAAIDARGADDIARANLANAQERLLAQQQELDGVQFVARSVDAGQGSSTK
jgi:tetratricopeptide (TPR) repeat protein